VAERSFAWLHRNRCLLIRYERRPELHQAFLDLGAALICWQLLTPTDPTSVNALHLVRATVGARRASWYTPFDPLTKLREAQ
jgi:hypothetical protein